MNLDEWKNKSLFSAIFYISLFLLPLFAIVCLIPAMGASVPFGIEETLINTVLQSVLSAFFILIVGYLGALGIFSIRDVTTRQTIEVFLMIPGLLPSFFVILSSLRFFDLFSIPFPFGVTGIVFAHVACYSGLCAVVLANIFTTKLSGMAVIAEIEGASRFLFLKSSWGFVRKDIFHILYGFFLICFTGFSIPLILGGGGNYSIDVLTQRLLIGTGQTSAAVFLSIIQCVFLFIFSIPFRAPSYHKKNNYNYSAFFGSQNCLVLTLFATVSVIFCGLWGVRVGMSEVFAIQALFDGVIDGMIGTIFISLLTGLIVLIFSFWLLLFYPAVIERKFLLGFSGLSGAIIGFGFLIIYEKMQIFESTSALYLFISVALGTVFFPSLFRMRGESAMSKLQNHFIQSKVMGASTRSFLFKVAVPLIWADVCFMAGLAALWAGGEFAISQMIAGRAISISLLAQSLLGGYRLDVAAALILISLIVSFVVCLFFWGIGRVGYRESQT